VKSTTLNTLSGTRNYDAIPMFQIEIIREMKMKKQKQSKSTPTEDNDRDSQCKENFKISGSVSEPESKDRPFGHNITANLSNSIEIKTSKDGINYGRSYYLKVGQGDLAFI
jgi:hypothetical protein